MQALFFMPSVCLLNLYGYTCRLYYHIIAICRKVWLGGCLENILSSSVWREKFCEWIDQPNSYCLQLLATSDGFSLANHRQFSTHQTSPLQSSDCIYIIKIKSPLRCKHTILISTLHWRNTANLLIIFACYKTIQQPRGGSEGSRDCITTRSRSKYFVLTKSKVKIEKSFWPTWTTVADGSTEATGVTPPWLKISYRWKTWAYTKPFKYVKPKRPAC